MQAPVGGYGVIYADPPWKFQTRSVKGKGRSAEAHYDCMSISDLANRPVHECSARDSVLLVWVTDPMLAAGLALGSAWGFVYKTVGFYWAKTSADGAAWPIGAGYWTRANPEQCLLFTCGHPKRINADVRKLIVSPRREHSHKPDEVYDRIERLCGGPYVELFARNLRPGWASWGNQAEIGIAGRRWASNSFPDATA